MRKLRDEQEAGQVAASRPTLEYPCRWLFKVIGPDPELMRQAIAEVARDRPRAITPSNSSKTGRYHALNLEMTVMNEKERRALYAELTAQPAIRIVL